MFEPLIFVAGLVLLFCFQNCWKGLYVCIVIGFMQDPLRKLIPGKPIYLTALVLVFFVVTLLGALSSGWRIKRSTFWQAYPDILSVFSLFALIVVLQSVRTVISTGNPIIAALGSMGYLLPLMALLFTFEFAVRTEEITQLFSFYIFLGIIFLSGVFFEAILHYDWPILGSVGEQLNFYGPDGVLVLYAGFMRSSEISAWHGALVVMLSITLYLSARLEMHKLLIAPAAIAINAILFTGRRKALAEIGIFIVSFITLSFLVKSHSSKTKMASSIIVALCVVGLLCQAFIAELQFNDYNTYLNRGQSTYADSFDRFYNMTIYSFQWVINDNSIWGSGAGTGSQGVQHFGIRTTGSAAEGGFAKVLAELGVPGLIVLAWFIFKIGFHIWKALNFTTYNTYYKTLIMALSSIMVANIFHFSIGHQAHGDSFILIMSGTILGFILAIPVLNKNLIDKGVLLQLEKICAQGR